jgi:thioredoxin 1
MAKPMAVTEETFDAEVLKSGTPVLVDFWATWCGPCRMIAPVVEEIADEYEGKLKVAKVDVDANPNLPATYGIRGIPTLLIFKDGKLASQIVGAVPKKLLMGKIDAALA